MMLRIFWTNFLPYIKRLSQVALPLRLTHKVSVWAAYGSDQQVLRNTFSRI